MIFQDITRSQIIAINSVNEMREVGIYQALEINWYGIFTIKSSKTFRIQAEYTENNDEREKGHHMLSLLSQNLDMFNILHEEGDLFTIFPYMKESYAIIPFYRGKESLKAFIFHNKKGSFMEKDLFFLALYIKSRYNAILLKDGLTQRQEFLEDILDSSSCPIFVINNKYNILSFNKPARNLFDDKTPPKNIYNLLIRNFEDISIVIDSVYSTAQKCSINKLIFEIAGEVRIFDVTFAPLRNSVDEVCGVVCVGTDITNLQISNYEYMYLKQYSMMGEVALSLSHDIKNPLTNIRGCTNFLKKGNLENEGKQNILNLILSETDRINDIIEEMMSFGNVGKVNKYALLDVNEILQNCIQIVTRQKLFRAITTHCDFSEKVPLINMTNSDIQQLFLNILINAMEAIQDQGIISISTSYEPDIQNIRIKISDDGVGIPKENLTKTFQPYFTTKSSGTGLGLFIAKKLVDQYGGKICLHSTIDVGTTCEIFLPAQNTMMDLG